MMIITFVILYVFPHFFKAHTSHAAFRHHTQMKRTEYGYVCVTEYQIEKKLDKELKKRLRKEGAFNLNKKETSHHGKRKNHHT